MQYTRHIHYYVYQILSELLMPPALYFATFAGEQNTKLNGISNINSNNFTSAAIGNSLNNLGFQCA